MSKVGYLPAGVFNMYSSAPRKPKKEEKPKGYWEGGDKFTVRDGIAGALAAVGDGLTSWAGGGGAGTLGRQTLIGGRRSAIEQAKAAKAAAQQAAAKQQEMQARKAAFVRAGGDPNAFDAMGGDIGSYLQPTSDQKNFRGYQGMDPNERREYDQFKPVVVQGPQGPTAVPRSSLGGGGSLPSKPVGKLTPIQPTTQNTQPPQLGSNGLPSTLTRAQYQAVVNAKGQQATDEWMRRNGITVSN